MAESIVKSTSIQYTFSYLVEAIILRIAYCSRRFYVTTDMGVLSLGSRLLKALREIGEGCLNGDVKKSSGKIQDMKRDSVHVLWSTRSYKSKTNLQRAWLHYQS